ncbi:MAG: FliG C-terminal domain-containing protein [Elusimicrobiota bacterium]
MLLTKTRLKSVFKKAGCIFMFFPILILGIAGNLSAQDFMEIELESKLEDKLKSKIVTYLGTENVITNINFTIEQKELEDISEEEERTLLPGIPTEKTIDSGAKAYQRFIEDMTVSIFIGKELSPSEENGLVSLIEELFPFEMELGENLTINQYSPSRGLTEINFVAIAIGVLSLALIIIFFGPVQSVFSSIDETIASLSSSESSSSASTGKEGKGISTAAGGDNVSASSAPMPAAGGEGKETSESGARPFSFIEKKDLPALKHILEKKSTEATATVLYSLPGELSGDLFSSLSSMKRKKVLSISRKIREPKDDITDLEEEIKFKVNYSYGGAEKLSEIVQNTKLSTREEIFKFLKSKDKSLLEKVKSKIFQFEDLVHYSEKDFNNIARKVGVKRIATIINNIPGKTGKQLMDKLTPQLKALAVEHSKASPDLNPKQLERERVQLQDMLFQMGEQGIITTLENIKEGSVD